METLEFAIVDNPITPDLNDGRAMIVNQKTVDLEQIEQEMVAEGSGLTLPQAKAYNEKLFQLIEQHVARGERVNISIVIIRPTITGVFFGKNDNYDPARHKVNVRVNPGLRLRKLEKTIKPEKVKGPGAPMPEPQEFIDAASGEKNRVATPGGIATLRGYYLKFDLSDPEQGIFFITVENPAVTVRVEQYTGIKPSEVHFLVPALPNGAYRIEARAILAKTKNLRTGGLDELIEV
jgi:hypothetical protein